MHERELLHLHVGTSDQTLIAARQCEQDVFLEAFGNTAEELHDEYAPYDDQSLFLSVTDDSGKAWGACRIITPGRAGLKTLNDVVREPWQADGPRIARAMGIDADNAWDIATLGVRADAGPRRFTIAMALFHGVVAASQAAGIPSMTAMLDERARRLLASIDYNLSMMPGTRPATYLGSKSTAPVFGHATPVLSAQRRLNPQAHRLMTLGIGLDGIVIPTRAEYRLPQSGAVIMHLPVRVPTPIRAAG